MICVGCHKTLYKKNEEFTPHMEINNLCRECSEKQIQYGRNNRPDLLDCENFGFCLKTQCKNYPNCNKTKVSTQEYFRNLYLMTHKLYSKMIQFGLTTEEELNRDIPNWKELEEKETNYMYFEKYENMKNYWPKDKIEKIRKNDIKHEEYLGLR